MYLHTFFFLNYIPCLVEMVFTYPDAIFIGGDSTYHLGLINDNHSQIFSNFIWLFNFVKIVAEITHKKGHRLHTL